MPKPERAPARSVERADRNRKIIGLRKSGFQTDDIARQLDCTESTVISVINRWLTKQSEAPTETVEKIRALQLSRLDDALAYVMEGVRKGNLKAVDRLIRLEQLRSKISGTEAPQRHEHTGEIQHSIPAEEIARMTRAWVETDGDVVDAEVVGLPVASVAGD